MKRIFFGIFILVFFAWQGYQFWPMKVSIQGIDSEKNFFIRMPLKDKKYLDFFFREVCFLGVWSYTLIGSKPMSCDQYTKSQRVFQRIFNNDFNGFKDILYDCFCPPHFRRICWLFSSSQTNMKLGWRTLNKYFSYFPNSRFVLYADQWNDREIVCLSLVDKIKLVKIVKEYYEDFKIVLDAQKIELEDLYDNEKLDLFLKNLDHEGLYGTLLGFGRDNAWLFNEYKERGLKEKPMVSAWREEELANCEELNRKSFACELWELSDLFYPRFACDLQSEETKQLKKIYREEREKIINYFEGKDLVEAALSLFNQ